MTIATATRCASGRRLTATELGPVTWTRHLLYFIYPVAGNGVWQRNVEQLLRRIDLFAGRRVCAVAWQPGTVRPRLGKAPHSLDRPEAVRAALAGHGFEFLDLRNDTRAGESVAFLPLWRRVADRLGRGDATFYAHAKGVTYADPAHHVHRWAELLYAANLDHWPLAERHFGDGKAITGALRRASPCGRHFHYSGTMFWFRNRATFARRWEACPRTWGGVEMWPGRVFRLAESGCIFHDEPPTRSAYDPTWLDAVLEQFQRWQQANPPATPAARVL